VRERGGGGALLTKAAEAKVLRTSRVRADATVVPAIVCYPIDSRLLAKAIRRIGTSVSDPQRRGGVRTRLRDRSRWQATGTGSSELPPPIGS
jgi:IS5 family transposase